MLMYDYKNGMQLCLFLDIDDPNFTCDDCDFRDKMCDGAFYRKHGILRRKFDGIYTRPKD